MKNLLFVLLAFTAITFTSCSKDKETTPKIIGTWKLEKVLDTQSQETIYTPENHEFIKITEENKFTSVFLDDENEYARWYESGTYIFSDNYITFSDYINEGLKEGKIVFKNNDTLEITAIHDGEERYTLIYSRSNVEIQQYIDNIPAR